jgi:hypothetical protein
MSWSRLDADAWSIFNAGSQIDLHDIAGGGFRVPNLSLEQSGNYLIPLICEDM